MSDDQEALNEVARTLLKQGRGLSGEAKKNYVRRLMDTKKRVVLFLSPDVHQLLKGMVGADGEYSSFTALLQDHFNQIVAEKGLDERLSDGVSYAPQGITLDWRSREMVQQLGERWGDEDRSSVIMRCIEETFDRPDPSSE